MIDYLNDINETDLKDFATKMCKEITEQLSWWDFEETSEDIVIEELTNSLQELQNMVKENNFSKLSPLYYYVVERYLE